MTDLARRVLALHRAGKNYVEIAAELGCSVTYPRTVCYRNGLLPLGKRGIAWTYERSHAVDVGT